jgi:3-oxoacyl-(acyl-carrier-protein) synthase
MRRVVVTGLGIVSSIGNDAAEVQAALRDARSGISFSPDFAEYGFRSQVWGMPTLDPTPLVDRRAMRFLHKGGAWNHVAMQQAIADAGLEESEVSNERTGIIMGSGGPSEEQQPQAHRPVRGAQGDVVDGVGHARHLVQDPRRQLFDLLGLLDLGALHRQRL